MSHIILYQYISQGRTGGNYKSIGAKKGEQIESVLVTIYDFLISNDLLRYRKKVKIYFATRKTVWACALTGTVYM